jgi:hypothetical protein
MEALVNWLTSENDDSEKSVVKHRRNGSPYVNPNELVEKAGSEAILGDVSKSLDELE